MQLKSLYPYVEKYMKKYGIDKNMKSLYKNTNLNFRFHVVDRNELKNISTKTYEFGRTEKLSLPHVSENINCDEFPQVWDISTNHTFERPFIAKLESGRIMNNTGWATTDKYHIILDSDKSIEHRIRRETGMVESVMLEIKSNINNGIDEYDLMNAVPFTSINRPTGFTNYYVWVTDYLTKLQSISYYSQISGKEPKIIIPDNSPGWVLDSLKTLGYGDQIVIWEPSNQLHVKNLIVPSVRRNESLYGDGQKTRYKKPLPPSACTNLRANALEQIKRRDDHFSSNVFISRDDANKRQLKNRDEIMDKLSTKGFVSYTLSDMSFSEQVLLFNQADKIVGVHGAGLVNLVFAEECEVTEIMGDIFIPTYYTLSKTLGHNYQVVSGESLGDPKWSIRHQDIVIDPNKLTQNIGSH